LESLRGTDLNLRPSDCSDDGVLGHRLLLRQPKQGHRVGHDAILLAASTPAQARDVVADLGAGVGAAGLALARRVGGISVTLVEIDPSLASLAAENAERNGLADRVRSLNLDVAAPAQVFSAAGLGPGSIDRVLMNPPFHDASRERTSPDRRRRLAHSAPAGSLSIWVEAAARLLRRRGTMSLIWRAAGLGDVLSAVSPLFGAIAVLPIYGQAGQAAIRVLVRAVKGSSAPLELLPGLTLNDSSGHPTPEAEAVLRELAPLPLANWPQQERSS
jgi:tRNA1(Val) A37 N6-methylase TrmN6